MRLAFPSFAIVLLAAAAPAWAAAESPLRGAGGYERCLELVKGDARNGAREAETWHAQGGGAAALHCEALALTALHRYAEAATKLDQAALIAPGSAVRTALYDQAGNAWLLAGAPDRAEASINSALALAPRDEDILFDRARARAARKNWQGADADLSTLLAMDPDRADAWVLRGSARHAEGRKAEAAADIAHALSIYPDYAEALDERAAMKLESGDTAGARADWMTVVRSAPNGDAAQAAREHLSEMDAAAAKPATK
jgi:tetratricopeptide (TPR) repeat protein